MIETQLISRVLPFFVDLLRRRLTANIFTTEDSVRYTLFAALLQLGVEPESVVLEYPHPFIENARVDTVLLTADQKPNIAIEFKYDRANRGGGPQPRPQKAGSIFADLNRLLQWPEVTGYLIYLTDGELARYWAGKRSGLAEVFNLNHGKEMRLHPDYFVGRSATFHTNMGDWKTSARLRMIGSSELPRDHHLKVFTIVAEQNEDTDEL